MTAGVVAALHSDLFILHVIEVADLPEQTPISSEQIIKRAQVPVGKISLVDLDLAPIEKRLLKESWVRSVRLQKRFPQTLSISVELRTPVALFARPDGKLAYVDSDGSLFGQLHLAWFADLPLLSAVAGTTIPIPTFLELLKQWDGDSGLTKNKISELRWDPERGARALVGYGAGFRTWIEMGEHLSEWEEQIPRLSQVLGFLGSRSIAARQIWADSDKKIVVKTAHGS